MKMRLPKTLMVALVAAMAMNTASAVSHTVTSNETITSGSLTTDSVNPGATHVITKTGEETVSVTGSVTKYASLYVHEGEVKVGDGVTDTTLTVRPYQTIEGSLIIGGQDAVVTFDNANYKNANNGFIGVGTQDGSGKLYLTNGSTMTGDCEKFTIGSSTYASTSGYNEGTFHEAANGSGEKFGRGEVFVSGGSKMDTAYRSFYMGEGLLSVEGTEGNESSVVIGNKESSDDSYKGYRVLLGIEKNSTSDIEVSGYGKVEVNAGEFRTNTASNSTTNITVSGPGAEFNVGDVVGKYTTAWVGYDNDEGIEDSSTNFNVENGGAVNFTNDRMVLGGATSEQNGNSVSVKVQDDESSFNFKGTSASMYAGVAIENKGTVKIDSANSFYMSGGEIVNDGSFTTNDIDISGAASSIKNNGTFTAEDYTQKGGETVNNGTISAKTYYQTAGETVNNGTIALTGSGEFVELRGSAKLTNNGTIGQSWIQGASTLVAGDGSTMGRIFMGDSSSLVVAGAVTLTGKLSEWYSDGAKLVFTEDGVLDMSGNSITLGNISVLLQVDGTVGQLTRLEEKEFFQNYNADASDIDEDLDVLVVGSDGSYTLRKLGDINNGIVEDASGNQSAVYKALQSMVLNGAASSEIEALVTSRDPEALKAALDALSGHEYATAMSSQIDGNMAHLRRLRGVVGKGAALAPSSLADVDGKGGMPSRRPIIAGVSVFHDYSELDSDAYGDGYDRSETGATVNAEYQLNNNLSLGAALSYGRTKLSTDNSMSRHEDNTRLDAYALYGKKRWSFVTSLGLGKHEHELKRSLGRDNVNGYSINFMQDVAYTVYSSEKSTVQLVGTLESSWNSMSSISDGYLYADDQSAWSTDVTVGVRYMRALRALGSAPEGMFSAQVGVTSSVGDINPSMELGMGGYSWRQDCAKRDRWSWNMNAGVEVPVKDNVSVYGSADAELRGDSYSVGGQFGVRVAF